MTTVAAWTLDVSVAAKWYLRDEPLLDQADAILHQFVSGSVGLSAPTYFLDEAANILRTAVRRARLTAEQATRAYDSLLGIGIVFLESTAVRRAAALDLAFAHDIAYYDALYLHASIELSLPLLTADRPFFERSVGPFPTTTYLGSL